MGLNRKFCAALNLPRSMQGMLGGKISTVLQLLILFFTVLIVGLVCSLILFIV